MFYNAQATLTHFVACLNTKNGARGLQRFGDQKAVWAQDRGHRFLFGPIRFCLGVQYSIVFRYGEICIYCFGGIMFRVGGRY